jgi:hypothetical protein
MKQASGCLYAGLAFALVICVCSPARAQFTPQPLSVPAHGESFHIEFGVGMWSPGTDIVVSSAGTGALSGLAGTEIDAQRDLGFADQRLPTIQVVVRAAKAHKFRFDYVPISYSADTTVHQTIVFNGQRYQVGLPLTSTLDWKAYRFGYEYDFIQKARGFGGFILQVKYTDARVELDATGPQTISEFDEVRVPIPAIGGIARFYVVPNIALTADVTAFKLPTVSGRYAGHYVDVDAYATVNFTNYFGVQGGYRSINMGYLVKQDTGSFVLSGIYLGVVARY